MGNLVPLAILAGVGALVYYETAEPAYTVLADGMPFGRGASKDDAAREAARARKAFPDVKFTVAQAQRSSGVRIVYNRLLGGWYVVRGPHQTPLGGRHPSKEAAQAWLRDQQARRATRR